MTEYEIYYDEGLELYNKGFYLRGSEDIKSIIKALELFVKTNKLLRDNDILKPKTMCYIALCNYKIGNIELAYSIANKAKSNIKTVLNGGPFIGLSGEMIGENQINELIEAIEQNFHERIVNVDFANVNENIIDNSRVLKYLNEDNGKPGKLELENFIKLIGKIKHEIFLWGEKNNNPQRTTELDHLFDVYRTPLLYAWEKYGYGHHSDFEEELSSSLNYLRFSMQPKDALKAIISAWKSEPPLSFLGGNSKEISDKILSIYNYMLNEI